MTGELSIAEETLEILQCVKGELRRRSLKKNLSSYADVLNLCIIIGVFGCVLWLLNESCYISATWGSQKIFSNAF